MMEAAKLAGITFREAREEQPMNDALAIKRPEGPLPPFSGDTPTCPKCGNEDASTTFKAYGDCIGGADHTLVHGWHENERLCRQCRRCGYSWDEATIEPGQEPRVEWRPPRRLPDQPL